MSKNGEIPHSVSPPSENGMTRRQFLQMISTLGLALAVPPGLTTWLADSDSNIPEAGVLYRALRAKPEPLVSIARAASNAEEIAAGVRRAVDLLGGIGSIVKPGDRVLIKPNIVRDYSGETGITTDIRLVREVVRMVLDADRGLACSIPMDDLPIEDGHHYLGLGNLRRVHGENVVIKNRQVGELAGADAAQIGRLA